MVDSHIYLIRHGQSEANLKHLFLGHGNLDLTEKGYKQAELTADYLDSIPVDTIYASDLLRAYHTAECTAKRKGIEIITDKELREIHGGKWEFCSFDSLSGMFPEDFKVWSEDIGLAKPTDGESVKELAVRFMNAVTKIAENHPGQNVFIFSHATPIRTFYALASGKPMEELKNIPWPTNASVTHAIFAEGKFQVIDYSIDYFMEDLLTTLPKSI